MHKVFVDASVIIAAMLSPTGGSSKILELAKAGIIKAIVSQTVIDEVKSKARKIKSSETEVDEFIKKSAVLVRKRVTKSEITPFINSVDITDAHLIAGAMLTNSNYLVSLDKKHLLKQEIKDKFKPLKIVSPKEFLLKLISDDYDYSGHIPKLD